MPTERRTLAAGDALGIEVATWRTDGAPRAVVQILHGLAEHIDRYDRFAAACNGRGFAVVGHNHRGHGGRDDGVPGHFGDSGGWSRIVDDVARVDASIGSEFPDVPRILFGHSMGSYIAQSYVMRYAPALAALVLSGSTMPRRGEVRVARWLARLIMAFRGPRGSGRLFDRMSFGQFNERFAPNRTEFDWLSRDEAEVDKYVADPLCGAPATVGLWYELFGGLLEISDPRNVARVRTALPILITGGEVDPVGGAAALEKLAAAYRETGHERVTLTLYEQGRHEMLNEINRDRVTADWLAWMESAIAR